MTDRSRPLRPLQLKKAFKAAVSARGDLLVTLSRDVVCWDLSDRTKRFRCHPFSHPANCSISPDGRRIAVKNTSGQIAMLDSGSGALLAMLASVKDNEGSNVVHSACGNFLVDGSWDGTLTVRHAATGIVEFSAAYPGQMITKIARSQDGARWFVVHRPKAIGDAPPPANFVSVWSWPFTEPMGRFEGPDQYINELDVSPDGTRVCVQGHDVVGVLRYADRELIATAPYRFGGSGYAVAWSPDGNEIASVEDGRIVFHDADSLAARACLDIEYPSDVVYAPDGRDVVLGSWTAGLLIERDAIPHVK